MIIDFKYHITSLIAVFIALGLGIFIGSTLVGDGLNRRIVEQQQQMVNWLEADYDLIKTQNKEKDEELLSVNQQLLFYRNFAEEVFSNISNEKIKDYKLSLIEIDKTDCIVDVIEKLEKSGAEVISTTSFLEGLENLTVNNSNRLLPNLSRNNLKNMINSLATTIGEVILSGEYDDLVLQLEQLNIAKNTGLYGSKLDGVILISGDKLSYSKITLEEELINFFVSHGLPVYIVSDSNSKEKIWNQYKKYPVTIIENIDTIPGQTALIMSLANKRSEGHFGISAMAQSLLPIIN